MLAVEVAKDAKEVFLTRSRNKSIAANAVSSAGTKHAFHFVDYKQRPWQPVEYGRGESKTEPPPCPWPCRSCQQSDRAKASTPKSGLWRLNKNVLLYLLEYLSLGDVCAIGAVYILFIKA